MRIAAIDCGTNTILCLIADADSEGVVAVEDHARIVRLGEGIDSTKRLKPEAIARTLAVLGEYVERIRELGCAHVLAVGTESLRAVENGHELINAATTLLGQVGGRFQVIDGDREARLSWRAVRASFPEMKGVRTVVDIGGGSTEILVGEAEPEEALSIPIGSVRLTERFLNHDPPTAGEKRALVEAIDQALATGPAPRGEIVGIAGTVTTLAAMAMRMTVYDGDRVHGSFLSRETLAEMARRLGDTPVDDRKRTPGLDPKRADVIYAGAVILERIVARAGAPGVRVSDRGIRWGLCYEAVGLGAGA
jgi:exopolyphosphatase/guanosine-5'-triphosphate,3'-diphosphate pyrophosphatase